MNFPSQRNDCAESYIEGRPDFARPMLTKLCVIVRRNAPHLEEAIRWNAPSWKGNEIVCAIAAFKKHVSITFWRGAELSDPRGQLVHGYGRSAMRTAKFTALDQLDEKVIRAWVIAAVDLDNAGPAPKPKREKKPEPVVPPVLAAALAKNAKARTAFAALSPSHRREYCAWIAGAKQEATVQRRVEKALEMLSAGGALYGKKQK